MKYLVVVFSALLLSACATTYQSQGFTGGYTETQLDVNVFRVSFNGNAYTSRDRVADFTLLRSAELTLENGYKYFVVVDATNYSKQGLVNTPQTTTTNANVNVYGNTAYGTATSTTTGGNSYVISKPGASNTIVMLEEKPTGTYAYNAEFLAKSLKEKYDITKE